MRLFDDFKIKFEQPNWSRDLELGLIDTILEKHPHLIALLAVDITKEEKILFELNKIAISEGLEDLEKIRQDSTVVETNIHYPANNSLLWDCTREAYRLLGHLKEEVAGLSYTDYWKEAKRTYFKINVTQGDKHRDLFYSQLWTFVKTINQVSNVVKKSTNTTLRAWFYVWN